jgi:radical SAM superfamily enzyme YgiQ (UPF0313 family)
MNKRLDTILINPSALKLIYQELSNEYSAIEPPIWAGLLANNLRKNNFAIDIIDCEGSNLTLSMTIDLLKKINTKLVTIVVYGQQPSASTQNMYGASLLSNEIKKQLPHLKVLLMGGHIAALPEKSITEENTDFVCDGEGVDTLNQLLKCDMESMDQLNSIPGLWYKRADNVYSPSKKSTPIPHDELDSELPGIAFDLLPMENYRSHNWHSFGELDNRKPYASIYTSLGCPFKCSFCCINAPFGKPGFRYWTPKFIVDQIEHLVTKYKISNLKIADEMFVLQEKHYLNICREIIQRGIKGLNIWAYARVDTVKVENLALMRKAGIKWLILGIESKSKYVREGVSKGQFKEETIIDIVRKIQASDINVHANYIFGLPDDNFDSMNETLNMALEINAEMSNFYSAMAYPGSKLYNDAVKFNLTLPENWLGYSQHSKNCLPLPTKYISGNEVLGFRDAAWNKYFTNEKYLLMLKNKFGKQTQDHIVELSRNKLSREHSTEYFFKEF